MYLVETEYYENVLSGGSVEVSSIQNIDDNSAFIFDSDGNKYYCEKLTIWCTSYIKVWEVK